MAQRRFLLSQISGSDLDVEENDSSIVFTQNEQIIGRSERSDFEINVPSISRQHARIWLKNDIPMIRDLDSGHGTYVNSVRIKDATTLKQGDLVAFGKHVVFLVGVELSAEADAIAEDRYHQESSADSSLVELALTDAIPDKRYREYYQALEALNEKLINEENIETLLSDILETASHLIQCDRFLALLGNSPARLEVRARKLRQPNYMEHWNLPSKSILRRGFLAGKPIISFDAKTDDRFKERHSIALSNVRSALCVPIRSANGPIGVLYCDTLVNAGLQKIEDGSFLNMLAHFAADKISLIHDKREQDSEKSLAPISSDEISSILSNHMNRMLLLADKAENEHQIPTLAKLMQSELERLQSDIEAEFSWESSSTTVPNFSDSIIELLTSDPDEEDRKLDLNAAPIATFEPSVSEDKNSDQDDILVDRRSDHRTKQ